jgi:uncharacterized protein YbbC (DUF1343 family)
MQQSGLAYRAHAINLQWLLQAYQASKDKATFFNSFFVKLAGTDALERMIKEGKSEKQIRDSWQADLKKFREVRKKYLLYPDFDR